MSTLFQPSNPLETAIVDGDCEAALALLRAMPPAERHGHRAALMRMLKLIDAARWGGPTPEWGGTPSQAQRQALDAAIFVCGTANDVLEIFVDETVMVTLGREFRPRALQGLADAMLTHSPHWIRKVQALIAAGLAPRPDSEAYVLGIMSLPRVMRSAEKLQALFDADPGLKAQLLRVFEIEGTADVSLASSDKYNHQPALAWDRLLSGLIDDGLTTHAELLDRTLGALEKDWPPYRAGWFSRFHGVLAPEAAAMRPHLGRYLALTRSRIAPTVALALGALRTLDDAQPIDGSELLDALEPAMASGVKAQLDAALKLADRLVKREPALAPRAATVVAMGLLHEAPALQGAVLKRLAAWGVDDALRVRLAGFAPGIAAVHREAWTALVGEVHAPDLPVPSVTPEAAPAIRVDPLHESRRLAPIRDMQDLVEHIAHCFEHPTDADAFESALARLVEIAPLSDADKALFAPVRKRAAKLQHALPANLARLMLFVLDGTRRDATPGVDHGGNESPAGCVLIDRVNDLMNLAAQGRRLAPLSAPTHQGGFIAPGMLVERIAAHQAAGLASSTTEQVLALLRLALGASDEERAQARGLKDDAFTRALRHALGDDVPVSNDAALVAAAARIRHPRADDEAVDRRHPDLGPDAALASRHVWRVESQSHEYDGKTYWRHDLHIDTIPVAPGEVPAGHLAVRRHPPAGEVRAHYRWWSFGGIDEGTILWAMTLLPSDPEAMLAEGARAVGNNLDWSEAQWQNRAYLALLLEPTVAIESPMSTLLLALGLAGKEPGQTAMAVDALVQSRAEGRLDLDVLGDTLRALLATPLVRAARLHKSLQAAVRADAAMQAPVFSLLCAMVQTRPEDPPRDIAALLELLLELKVGGSRPLPAEARDAIAAMSLGGKGRSAQRALLG